MIVFKMNSVLIVATFILSLRKLNAPPDAENEDNEIIKKRSDCVDKVSTYFKEEDNSKRNAKRAFDQFQLVEVSDGAAWTNTPDLSCCTFHRTTMDQPEEFPKFSDVFAYFILFKEHLLSDGIPSLSTFCKEYEKKIVNPETCAERLALIYTGSSEDQENNLPTDGGSNDGKLSSESDMTTKLDSIPEKCIHTEETARVDIEGVIDLSLEYFNRIRSTFKLQMKENGMPGPQKFCNERYK